jgi:hypothetical protein
MHYEFSKVSIPVQKSTKCVDCGKSLRRQASLWQTLNPWNKMPDGRPKTREDILVELRAERERWRAQPERCKACAAIAEEASRAERMAMRRVAADTGLCFHREASDDHTA